MVSSGNEKARHKGGSVGLIGRVGAPLRAAAEDLELQGDPGQQRQHHAGGDEMDRRLHGRAAHEADAVERRIMVNPTAAQETSCCCGPAGVGLGKLLEMHADDGRDRRGPGGPHQREGHRLACAGEGCGPQQGRDGGWSPTRRAHHRQSEHPDSLRYPTSTTLPPVLSSRPKPVSMRRTITDFGLPLS